MLKLNRWFRNVVTPMELEITILDLEDHYVDGYSQQDVGQTRSPTYVFRVDQWCSADTKWFIKKLFGIGQVATPLFLVWSRDPAFAKRPTLDYCSSHPLVERKVLKSWDAFVNMHLKTKKARGEARDKYKDWFQWFNQGEGVPDPIHMTPSNHPVPTKIPL